MKKKKIIISIVVIIILILGDFIGHYNSNTGINYIPNNYIAIFHSDDSMKETYIYKIENDHNNYGFKYINVTCTLLNDKKNCKTTSSGEFDWTDGVFKVAEENNAYSYVTTPNSDTKYSIEQFQSMFIMN